MFVFYPPSRLFFFSCLCCSFSQSVGECADSSWFWPSTELFNGPKRHPSILLIKRRIVNFVFDDGTLSTPPPLLSFSFLLHFHQSIYDNEEKWTLDRQFLLHNLFCHTYRTVFVMGYSSNFRDFLAHHRCCSSWCCSNLLLERYCTMNLEPV